MALRAGAVTIRRGFSLVELLVALALLSVVVLIMGLLMNSLRINSEVLLEGFGEEDPAEYGRILDADLRMLLRSRPDEDKPVLALTEEEGLLWRRLLPDEQGRLFPAEVQVFLESGEAEVLRVLRPASGNASTNTVWRSVSRLNWTFWDGEAWTAEWPPDGREDALPRMLRADITRPGGDTLRYDLLVPASLRLEPEE